MSNRNASCMIARVFALLVACMLVPGVLAQDKKAAQDSKAPRDTRSAQRKLEQAKRELGDVAAERRKIEGERGEATRKLRVLDEQVGKSTRALNQSEANLKKQQDELQQLQAHRDGLEKTLGSKREELARLLRSAYTVGGDAPLKLLLSQDSVAEGNRVLAWHGYLQRDRARRVKELQAELAGLTAMEQRITQTSRELEQARKQHQAQLAKLAADRKERNQMVAQLDAQARDKRSREQELGRDVQGLEKVLAQLREAARRAEAERRAAAAKAAREAREAERQARTAGRKDDSRVAGGGRAAPRPKAPVIANATPIQVGGLGWPLSGTLVTPFGGTLPDGRRSAGILIAAAPGSPVRAVANGKVVFAEWMAGYGLICIVDHGNGYMSLYANNDGLLKDVGADVKRGDTVASVGNSGGQGRTGLYFELRRGGSPVDPRAWLQKQ